MSGDLPHATALRLRSLAEAGILTRAQAANAERLLRTHLPWRTWIERLLLTLGATLLLAGIIFFFAYNWAELSPMQKFATAEVAIALCAAAAWWKGLETVAGQVLLTATCVLVGVFLAIFGQIYQIGADTYELFTGWALLIFPWVLFARFGGLWLLWLVLLNVGLVLSWEVRLMWPGAHFSQLCTMVGLLNLTALAAREGALAAGYRWLQVGWLRSLPCLAGFGGLTLGAVSWLIDPLSGAAWSVLPLGVFLVAAAAGVAVYRYVLPSLSSLAIIVLGVCLTFVTLVGKHVLSHQADPFGVFLMMGVVVVCTFGAAAWWLRRTGNQMRLAAP